MLDHSQSPSLKRRHRSLMFLILAAVLMLAMFVPVAAAHHRPGHGGDGGDGGAGGGKPDRTAPETTITSAPPASTTSTTATFAFVSNEANSTFECSLDGQGWQICESPRTYSGLATGNHTFRVRATDAAGNVDKSPASHSWTIAGPPPPGPGTPVSCGQVLTGSTTVGNSLSECEEGLVIGADNITLDLNGHTIDGKGLGVGVRNDGFDGVTIKNGTVADFDHGVQLNAGTRSNLVETVAADYNEIAGFQVSGDTNTIRNSTALFNGHGVVLVDGATGNVVLGNVVVDNSKEGLRVQGSNGNRLESNQVTGSSDGDILLTEADSNVLLRNTVEGGGDGGINVEAGSDSNRLEANTSSWNGDAGINVSESHGNELIANTLHRNADSGIVMVNSSGTLVRGNDLRFNPAGVEMLSSSGNRLESNIASENHGRGMEIGGDSLNNVLLGNTASANSGQGIYLDNEAPSGDGNLLDGNTGSGNSGNGIHVAKGGHTIARNTVNDNSGWGIYTAAGNADGGGNRASGNSEPGQCFGVVCR
jgi:large repetitive protein